jgi:hypothetical protein
LNSFKIENDYSLALVTGKEKNIFRNFMNNCYTLSCGSKGTNLADGQIQTTGACNGFKLHVGAFHDVHH